MRSLRFGVLLLVAVGVIDYFCATQSAADKSVRRLGLHQDKSQAQALYFFIAHL